VRYAWYQALEQAKIDDFHMHDLRHSAASYLAMNGASLVEIAEVLGHKTLSMVRRYSHLAENHTQSVLERMADALDRLAARRESQTGRSTYRADVVREALAVYVRAHLPKVGV
jgi:integrase